MLNIIERQVYNQYRSLSAVSKIKLLASTPHGNVKFAQVRYNSNAVNEVTINWINKDDSVTAVKAKVGANFMRSAQANDIELEGACEGVCACSTCHIIFDYDTYNELDEPSEDEEDMLDQAFELTPTSRLGCQVTIRPEHDGITIKLPKATRNFYVDGHVPKPH